MAHATFDHADEYWLEKLTVPEQELTLSERDIVAAHVAQCPDCARIVAENAMLKRLIQGRSAPEIPSGLPPKLLQVWQTEDAARVPHPLEGDRPR